MSEQACHFCFRSKKPCIHFISYIPFNVLGLLAKCDVEFNAKMLVVFNKKIFDEEQVIFSKCHRFLYSGSIKGHKTYNNIK